MSAAPFAHSATRSIDSVALLLAAIHELTPQQHFNWFDTHERHRTLNYVKRRRRLMDDLVENHRPQNPIAAHLRLLLEDLQEMPHLGIPRCFLVFVTHALQVPSALFVNRSSGQPLSSYPASVEMRMLESPETHASLKLDARAIWPGATLVVNHPPVSEETRQGYATLLRDTMEFLESRGLATTPTRQTPLLSRVWSRVSSIMHRP